MSTLISSAVPGKSKAPKGAPRRRPAPPPGAAKQSTPHSVSSAQTSVPPPSPPPTQSTQSGQPPTQPADIPPAPTSPVQSRSQSLQTEPSRGPTSIRTPTPITIPTPTPIEQTSSQEEPLPRISSPQTSRKRKADQTSAKAVAQPAKRAKRSSARSNALVQAQIEDEEAPSTLDPALRPVTQGSVGPAVSASPAPSARAPKPKKARKSRKKARASAAESEDDGAQHDLDLLDQQLAASRSKRRRRKKKAQPAATESGIEADTRPGTDGEQQSDSSDSESDPELHEIDPGATSMFDVSYNKKYGKTSEREKKMAEIDWVEVARKRRETNDRLILAAQQAPTNEEVRETTEGQSGTAEPPPPQQEGTASLAGVRFRIVNGTIVEDESTLTIDRQAAAHAEAEDQAPVEEENDLTQRINRLTWINDRRRDLADRVPNWKRKSDPWTEEETDKFYEHLASFGTDFFIISTMLPPKTRRQIKAKFIREERLDPKRMNDALLGRKGTRPTLSLENYAREVGRDVAEFTKFENAEHAEEVIRESMREREQEMREAIREEEVQEEVQREALLARQEGKKKAAERKVAKAAARERRAAAGGGGGRKGGRKKAPAPATFGGGGPEDGGGGAAEG